MDAKTFLAEFGHIAGAPGGMRRLREMICVLAIRGELLSDRTAIEAEPILESIRERKRRHPEQRKVVRSRQPIDAQDILAPLHWARCRLGDLVLTITGGGTPSKTNPQYWGGNISWASVKDLRGGKYLEATEDHITEDGLFNSAANLIPPGRVIVCTRMGLGKIAVTRIATAINQDLKAFELPPEVDTDFFLLIYRTRDIAGKGTTVAGITQEKLLALPAAIPLLPEQQRIVAKVDELMALCDKLEAQQQRHEQLRSKTRFIVLEALANAKSSESLALAWSRAVGNFSELLADAQGAEALKDVLAKLAVRGLLHVWGNTRPNIQAIKTACEDLRRSCIDKKWLRKQKPVRSPLSDAPIYPPHWAVLPFDEVAIVIGGVTKGRDLRNRDVRARAYLRVANVQRGYFDLGEIKTIDVPTEEVPKYRVELGDLLVTEGGDWDKVGRTAIWGGEIEECLHQNHVFKARVPSPLLLNQWIQLVFNSQVGRDYFAGASKQTTNLASINMTQLRGFPLPIPPLDEQQAILQKFAELTSMCDELARQSADAMKVAAFLAQASVAAITGFRSEEGTPMKAPKTELISTLRLNATAPAANDTAPLAALLARHNGEMSAKALWRASGLEIDAFYQQLKAEMARRWIVQPEVASVREVAAN